MAWWGWLLVFVALFALSVLVLFALVRSLWRKAMALMEELGTAAEQLDQVTAHLERVEQTTPPAEPPAVFASPTRLRQQRHQHR